MQNPDMTKHYRVRKEIVWIFALSLTGYWAADWWMHLEWPPHARTYPENIEALNCPKDGRYSINQISELPKLSMEVGVIDRKMFFESPQCAAGLYLAYEGSGTRQKTYVYDLEKKRRTATIVTTFDKYGGE